MSSARSGNDVFAIIRWRDAGISPIISSILWSESVGAEVLVFVLLGSWLLGLFGRSGALALGAGAANGVRERRAKRLGEVPRNSSDFIFRRRQRHACPAIVYSQARQGGRKVAGAALGHRVSTKNPEVSSRGATS